MDEMSIFTVCENGYAELLEKKSRFIANVYHIESVEEATEIINRTKKQYFDARHNVYAYVIAKDISYSKYSDDGEPQGTAGLPILSMLKKRNLVNVLVIVTRYFGGILLGKGGLIKAYTQVAKMGIDNTKIVEMLEKKNIIIEFPYLLQDKILFLLNKKQYIEKEVYYSETVKMRINLPTKDIQSFTEELIKISGGRVVFVDE